ncbi:hypothetical protein CW745_14025 [Psychromonas sp. psych-6C06]|uniref:hypothetical protein n=1 Tax=Psychromonas sp. psych-6C06 TaxID=2058089 RepID=UPI000C34A668|nr:hypothetical protein [Psychromonas sp. psych-6C06]PKF60644.1 hypothetical protein CW745_14025 [Psychromonas sp. psych-6C06]
MLGQHLKIEKGNTSAFLEAFVNAYNLDLEVAENNEDTIELLEAKLEQSYLDHDKQQTLNEQLSNELATAKKENKQFRALFEVAEANEQKQIATQRELALSKASVAELQKELTKLKGGDNPKRLREQIKRIKEKSLIEKKRLSTAEGALKEGRRLVERQNKLLGEKDALIGNLKKELAHNTGSGLYHNDEHHLIIWPEKTRYEREDGSHFEGRSLLYLHQSGRGGLISFDPATGEAHMCKAPKNGLRPSEECKVFAKDWLYAVNALQDGIVQDKDMLAVNYNADLKPMKG